MKRSWLLCFLIVTLLAGCRGNTPTATQTATLSPTGTPAPTLVLDTPEATAAAFLLAWDTRNYEMMYGLLSPTSRAAVDLNAVTTRAEGALRATAVVTATTALQAVLQEGDRAQATYAITWDTALVGTLVTETTMGLTYQDAHWGVEWSGDLIWPGLGASNYLYMEYEIPARANIYDRNGLALASEGTIVTVGVIPNQIQDEQAVLAVLSQVTGLTPDEARSHYSGQPAAWWTPIADIPAQVSIDNAHLLLNTPGIEAREKDGRLYWGGAAPHIVGWVLPISAEELETYRRLGYRGDESVGASGLEHWGEPYLSGTHGGSLYLMNAAGQTLATIATRDAAPSQPLYTTLDREFQGQVQAIIGDRRGAIVVLDVHTGAIIALASGPAFDPNAFASPAGAAERSAIFTNPDRPLFNRTAQGTYPCGSVFKIVTIATALEAGGMTPENSFWCPGYWDGLGPAYIMDCWTDHGTISLKDALTASCDVTFYSVGQTLDGIDPYLIPNFARAFGFGTATGVEGILEEAGLVPDPAWKEATYAENWWVGDTVNISIGQGYLLVTPLQVAQMMAAVANGGTLYRPYAVDRVGQEVVGRPEATGRLPVSAQNLAIIQEALAGVTTMSIGTATHRFQGMSIPVAGKTGTAQAPGETSLPHSWFAAYAPADAPEIAIVVMVENAGEGSAIAAPMARQVVEAYYGLPLTPLPVEAEATPTP
ncbi:MAG: penicillin-binding protein 2, partial [Anaerolineae bacterium]|nr:penicillin-binding protein 2 [Anaerolineae bacterium]